MASPSSLSSSQPRLHGAYLLHGHILVKERSHAGEVVKALQDLIKGDTYKSKLNKVAKASFRKVALAEKSPLSSHYFLNLQKFVEIERDRVLPPVANYYEEGGNILSQMVFRERKPQNNPYRIKIKPTPIDKDLLTTLQAVPGLGQKKALSLLTQYGSIEQISKASIASLSTVVGKANAQQVKDFFSSAQFMKAREGSHRFEENTFKPCASITSVWDNILL